ncbi:MAG: hypothetical protein WD397_04715 [Wenzhouxiangellaceae bacterium]
MNRNIKECRSKFWSKFWLAGLAALLAGAVAAQPGERGSHGVLASADGTVQVYSLSSPATAPQAPGRGVQSCIDVSDVDSWDSLDDPDNIIIDVNISSSMKVVGIAWDVGIATVGDSWLSDASVLLSNSDGFADPNAIFLTPGSGDDAPGDQEFTSGGVALLADNGLPDIEPNADGLLRLQFFELTDDLPDAVDAEWRNAADPVTCPGIWLELAEAEGPGDPSTPAPGDPSAVPLNQPLAMTLLVLLLGLVAVPVLRRRP